MKDVDNITWNHWSDQGRGVGVDFDSTYIEIRLNSLR
jgi:hypothetical protein